MTLFSTLRLGFIFVLVMAAISCQKDETLIGEAGTSLIDEVNYIDTNTGKTITVNTGSDEKLYLTHVITGRSRI